MVTKGPIRKTVSYTFISLVEEWLLATSEWLKTTSQAIPVASKVKVEKHQRWRQHDWRSKLTSAKQFDEGDALMEAMLARQRELTIMTKTVDASRKNILTADGQLPAALVSKIDALAEGEGELELETIDALKLLEEDGTTAVFPPMVEQLRDELHDVGVGLRARRTGAGMNQAQKDVEDLLELLINALRRTIEKKEGGG